jgi:hypothetical protein
MKKRGKEEKTKKTKKGKKKTKKIFTTEALPGDLTRPASLRREELPHPQTFSW